MISKKLAALSLALMAIVMVSGCQTSPTRSGGDSDADIVKERAVQRWTYLVEKKAEKAYEYLTPGYRKTKSLQDYVGEKTNTALRWSNATANKAECGEDVCNVFVAVDYEVNLPNSGGKPISTFAPMQEKWVKVGNQWYYLPNK